MVAMYPYLLIALFGLSGVFSRFAIDRLFEAADGFPSSTLLINVGGSFIAGLIYALSERGIVSLPLQTGLLVGFCGGFTTFSAYTLQTFAMLDKGRSLYALAYLVGSPILGVTAAILPIFLSRKVF